MDIFKHKKLSNAELNKKADFLNYVLNNAGINFRDGGTITTYNIREVFGYPVDGCCQESPIIRRAYDNNLLIVVEKPIENTLLSGTRIGLRNRTVTANPFPNIPAKLLEYGNDYTNLRASSPQERSITVQKLIEEALKDTISLKERISFLETNANVMYDEILSQSSANTIELRQAGGFTIIPLGKEPIQKDIEQIEKAKKIVDGYSPEKLESVLDELKQVKLADKFYRGKPPLKQNELMLKEGEEGVIKDIYAKVIHSSPLTKEDVREYGKLLGNR
ncbi:MAG: hypothetical protein ABIF85_04935 [Nanoarchaeota archaeon]|nr:hypothetical protein [Nanoarchaeota archaeon]